MVRCTTVSWLASKMGLGDDNLDKKEGGERHEFMRHSRSPTHNFGC